MKRLKKIWDEFKKFISRGNVLDLAVGVIIATAFSAIVTSLTDDIIMPAINAIVGEGDLSSLCTPLGEWVYLADGSIDFENSLYINWGAFIKTILDFIIIAVVIFAIVKTMNTLREKSDKLNKEVKHDKAIRKLAKKIKKEQNISMEEAKAKAEAQIVAEEAPKPAEPPKPTVEELLTEIRNLLAANAGSEKSSFEKGSETETESK